MRLFIRRLSVVVLCVSFLLGASPQQTVLPQIPKIDDLEALVSSKSMSAEKATKDPIGYGWDLFFYANWPALMRTYYRGYPDKSVPFNTGGPVVWETWKNTAEVYLPDGATPEGWTLPQRVPADVAAVTKPQANSGDYWQHMTDDVQVDGFDLLDNKGQKVLYELLMNYRAYQIITTNTLYNVQGQMAFAATKGDLEFAFDAMEVKASWRWIDPNDTDCPGSSYFTTKAWYEVKDNNGNPVKNRTGVMGLTGLHIISKALPGWVWITFEHVDNAKCTKVNRSIPIDQQVAERNTLMRNGPLKGTKWANYEMVGVQTSMGTAEKPVLLANTQIESAFQTRSSCMTCHALASVASSKPADNTVPIRRSFVDVHASPPYFIGPQPALGTMYRFQDYVMSLRKANWVPVPVAVPAK